jgi:hypothetical protein
MALYSGDFQRWREMAAEERKRHECKICGNTPDEYGAIEHGKGCHTQSEDGGGTSHVEACCTVLPMLLDELEKMIRMTGKVIR